MVKIDLKDRKILYYLDLNCRQSNAQIGKKVGLKRDVVSYRINRLLDEGIIQNFYTVIDAYRLGYNLFRYYINFQYITPEIKKQIIDYFSKYKNMCTVGQATGKYDLILVIWVKKLNEFYQFWNKALDNYGDYFERIIFSLYIHGIGFLQSFLLPETTHNKTRKSHEEFGVGDPVEIDKLDYILLNELALNARSPLIELADKLKSSSQTINYRIKKLKEKQVIQAFRVALDLSTFGLKRFKVDIYLKEHKKRGRIISHIRNNPNIIYISTSTGLCDLEFEFVAESVDKLLEFIEQINIEFPGSIRNFSYYGDIKIYKETFLPKLFD